MIDITYTRQNNLFTYFFKNILAVNSIGAPFSSKSLSLDDSVESQSILSESESLSSFAAFLSGSLLSSDLAGCTKSLSESLSDSTRSNKEHYIKLYNNYSIVNCSQHT